MVNVIPRLDRGVYFGLSKLKLDHRQPIRCHFEHGGNSGVSTVIPRFNPMRRAVGIQHQRG